MKKQLSIGNVEIREIDVADKMILLGELGYGAAEIERMMGDEDDEEVSPEQMVFMGKMIKKFKEFVISIDITLKGVKVTDYNVAIRDQDFINELLPIVTQCLLGGEEVEEKKQD